MKYAFLILLAGFLTGCGEKDIKKILVAPIPTPLVNPPAEPQITPQPQPQPEPSPSTCQLAFQKGSLKQIANQAAFIAEACQLNEAQLEAMINASQL